MSGLKIKIINKTNMETEWDTNYSIFMDQLQYTPMDFSLLSEFWYLPRLSVETTDLLQ